MPDELNPDRNTWRYARICSVSGTSCEECPKLADPVPVARGATSLAAGKTASGAS